MKMEAELDSKVAAEHKESVARLQTENSKHIRKYESLKGEVSDVFVFIQRDGKSELLTSILESEKQKRPNGSVISGIILDKIRILNRPIPPTPPPSNDKTPYLDRQQIKEQNPMH
ncbi:hypothetical protein [Salinimonas chungwhensis]|uniref:hypothetical protein n=1 Tax=Salinimonas chungwhensis TaxID=265425 RepID=UPI0003608603|nr:hypothetical protein [Salinimonas chungwhensis]